LIVEVSFSSINEVYRLGVGFLTKWGGELTTGECSVEKLLSEIGQKIRQDGVVKFIGIIFCFVELCSETPEK